jgi:hypothetical protein
MNADLYLKGYANSTFRSNANLMRNKSGPILKKNARHTSQEACYTFTIKINCLMRIAELVHMYSESNMKHTNTLLGSCFVIF